VIRLDELRTAYIKAPPHIRRILSPLLALAPQSLLFGKTYQSYRRYIARSRKDVAFVAEWRRRGLRSMLKAALNAPHYHAVLGEIGLDESAIEQFEAQDLRLLPILTKPTLRASVENLRSCSPDELDLVSTSGSSGNPLYFYLEKSRSPIEWAFVQDSWAKIKYDPMKVRAVFRGVHLEDVDVMPWEYEPALRELRLSPFHLTPKWMGKYCELIQAHNATYLHGYPSAISTFANFVIASGNLEISRAIRGIMAISEAILPHQRSLIQEAFPKAKITSFYGMSEKVLFASEVVGNPGVYEMEPLYGILELVDEDGKIVEEPGTRGRIIGTSLLFKGFPFIRYDTEDEAELVEPAAESNLFRAKVRNITSRWNQEFLVGSHGQLISMTAINIHSEAYRKMIRFQFEQSKPGFATLKVIPAEGATIEDITPFVDEISHKIGSSIAFSVEITDRIALNKRGKARFIDQKLDLCKFGLP